jgi:crotonobetainyl-CoA:carnitine CoA-transferase CaiB-like acyl-CoA transferase
MASGQSPGKEGSGAAGIAPYKAYATRDGEVVIAAGSDGLFRSLAQVVGHPEWIQDARFVDNPSRVANQVVLYGLLDALIARETTAHWLEKLEAAGIPCAPVQSVAQMLAHPQTEAMGLVQPLPGSGMRAVGLPLSLNGVRPTPRTRPPEAGEHTSSILHPPES